MKNKLQKSDNKGLANSNKSKLDVGNMNLGALTKSLGTIEIPRLFYQLVIFVLDGSGSMSYTGSSGKSKGEEVEEAVKKTIERLHQSKNKNSFDISIWAYANESVQISKILSATDINLNSSIDPCFHINKYDGTNLTETLKSVDIECQAYLDKYRDKNAQALVVILSDGAIEDYEVAVLNCDNLKNTSKTSISSIFFESENWQENYLTKDVETLKNEMRYMASDDSFFASTLDPEEIRKHMIKSISTVSKVD